MTSPAAGQTCRDVPTTTSRSTRESTWRARRLASPAARAQDAVAFEAEVLPILRARCFDCHQAQRTESMKAFSHPFFQDKMDCASCHSPHGDQIATSLVRQTVNDTCQQCHAEQRGPYLWEHAPVSEDCTLCHSPHGSNHPGMLAKRAPLLCQSCHSQFGHPSVPYGPDELMTGLTTQGMPISSIAALSDSGASYQPEFTAAVSD